MHLELQLLMEPLLFHIFFSSLAISKPFSIFSTSLSSPLVSFVIIKSSHSYSYKMVSLYNHFQRIWREWLSKTASDWCLYHFGLTWISFTWQTSQWVRLPIYCFWASLGHSLTMWLIVPSALLQILHFVCSFDFPIFPLIRLVQMAWSWAAHIKLSVSRFRASFRSHYHLPWFPTPLICCTNWRCNSFSSYEIVLSSFFCSLASSLLDWLIQINIHRYRSSKQTCSALFYIVL